ncbi:MAG: acyl-CoA thioesterase [Tidjanibacter sp.]|nr:acyl-CoA thioesterase [Tidjanibacter sp.]
MIVFEKEIPLRVRYKETDQMGFVHHSNYPVYYEYARTEVLRSMGASYKMMEDRGVMMPVREVEMKFFNPARYDDLLTIKCMMNEITGARIRFDHEIRNQDGQLINTGFVELVFVNTTTRRPCHAPQWFVDLFKEQK